MIRDSGTQTDTEFNYLTNLWLDDRTQSVSGRSSWVEFPPAVVAECFFADSLEHLLAEPIIDIWDSFWHALVQTRLKEMRHVTLYVTFQTSSTAGRTHTNPKSEECPARPMSFSPAQLGPDH